MGRGRGRTMVSSTPWSALQPEPGTEQTLHHAIVARKLVLRSDAGLDSNRIGDVRPGLLVTVLEEKTLDDVVRARIGKDSTPRGVAVTSMGWVTAVKDGEPKLSTIDECSPAVTNAPLRPAAMPLTPALRLRTYAADIDILDPSFERLDMAAESSRDSMRGEGESMASRIARRRQARRTNKAATLDSPGPRQTMAPTAAPTAATSTSEAPYRRLSTGASSMAASAAAPPRSKSKPVKIEFLTSAELMRTVEKLLAEADEAAAMTFDTVGSRLGELMRSKKIKLDGLMKEWDRNHDGDISKQEFRLNIRKLGMTEEAATTKQLDELYDSLDLDGSNSLDLDEMREALQQLQSNVRGVANQLAKQQAIATSKRAVADVFRAVSETTAAYEAEEVELAAVRRGTAGTRLGALLKSRNIKIGELVSTWDKDGSGHITAPEFRIQLNELGLQATDEEIDELFQSLDSDSTEQLSINEVMLSFKRLLALTLTAKKEEDAKVKVVAKARRAAEVAQAEARRAQSEGEAKLEAEEMAALAAREAKEAEAAHHKAAEAAAKREKLQQLQVQSTKFAFM